MAEIKYLADTALQTVIDKGVALTNNSRAAGLYENDTELDLEAIAFLTLQYDGGPPAVGDRVADLYVLPGNGEATEVFPEGGDGTVGSDDTPQANFYVGSFESIKPSTSVNEVLALPIPLYPHGNRLVVVNTSGQSFDLTWQLDIKPIKRQVV